MWQPQSGHVSQLHPDGSGHADCFEASLVRYLREAGKLPLTPDTLAQVDEVSYVVRGIQDGPDNPYTDFSQAEQALTHYGIGYRWSDNFAEVQQMPWSICLVNGIRLAPAQYPASWFGGADEPQGDHFILWLPTYQGASNWFNDPLSWNNNQQDCQYDIAAAEDAFAGAFILPDTGHGEGYSPPATTPPQPKPPAHHGAKVKQACSLKAHPNHTSVGIARIPQGGEINVFNRIAGAGTTEPWVYAQYRDRYGWIPQAYEG